MKKQSAEKEQKEQQKLRKKDEDYTEWQIEKIRKGLFAYKLGATLDGKTVSDYDLALAVEISLPDEGNANKNILGNEKKDKYFAIKQEAIRRFLAGRPTEPKNLPIFLEFVLAEGLIDEEEFEESDDSKEFIKTFMFIGNRGKHIEKYFKEFKQCFRASRSVGGVIEEITIRLIRDSSNLFFRALERYEDLTKDHVSLGLEPNVKQYRRGYAFASTKKDSLHIFMRDENPESRITYVQVYPLMTDFNEGMEKDMAKRIDSRGNIFMVRGGSVPRDVNEAMNEREELLFSLGIYEYKPIACIESGFFDIDLGVYDA